MSRLPKFAIVCAIAIAQLWTSGDRVAARQAAAPVELVGIVVDAHTQAPVPFAQIQLSTGTIGSPGGHQVAAEDDGTFVIKAVPPGSYFAAAYTAGYSPSYYDGTTSASVEPVRGLLVRDGLSRQRVEIRLVPGAVIAGRVLDEHGEPAPQIRVAARRQGVGLPRAPVVYFSRPTAMFNTDAHGAYRLYGLEPGEYLVSVSPHPQYRRVGSPPGTQSSYAQVFYPGTIDPDDALRVSARAGQEQVGIDFRLRTVESSKVSGTIVAPSEPALLHVYVRMISARPDLVDAIVGRTATPQGERFVLEGVMPGRYWVIASGPTIRGAGPTPAQSEMFWSAQEVNVAERDVTGLVMALQPSMTISGRVVPADREKAPADLTQWLVDIAELPGTPRLLLDSTTSRAVRLDADGQFTFRSLTPGRYGVRTYSRTLRQDLTLESVSIAGVALPSKEFDIAPGASLTDVVLVVR